jgi:hypothetical protein
MVTVGYWLSSRPVYSNSSSSNSKRINSADPTKQIAPVKGKTTRCRLSLPVTCLPVTVVFGEPSLHARLCQSLSGLTLTGLAVVTHATQAAAHFHLSV